MKKTSETNYSLLLIPDDTREMRRICMTGKHLRFLTLACLAALFLFILSLIGFWHYRSLYSSLVGDREKISTYEQERKTLGLQVASLEKTVNETERLAGKLATMVGTERLQQQRGVGPIPSLSKMDISIAGKISPRNLEIFEGFGALEPKVDHLEERASTLEAKISELYKIQQDKLNYIASTPSIWPVRGWVTSDFGRRRSPFSFTRDFHEGIDIAAQRGTPIMAAADGVVTFSGYRGGLGKSVIIDHGFGVSSYYGHTSALLVHAGQHVTKGTKLALVGSTGHSTGPHLHYEIHVDGIPVDPMKYILQ